jgi:uncharacterized membrane protein (DUF373 family)
MTVVILLGVIDVVWVMYGSLTNDPVMVLRIEEILKLFGAFLAVLIAIEIFINITIYLREDVIHVRIVMATAMMAIARKVIILDPQEMGYEKMLGLGGIVFAMSIGYWLVVRKNEGRDSHGEDSHGHAGL